MQDTKRDSRQRLVHDPTQANDSQPPTRVLLRAVAHPLRAVAHHSSSYRRQAPLSSSLTTYIFRMRDTLRDGME